MLTAIDENSWAGSLVFEVLNVARQFSSNELIKVGWKRNQLPVSCYQDSERYAQIFVVSSVEIFSREKRALQDGYIDLRGPKGMAIGNYIHGATR